MNKANLVALIAISTVSTVSACSGSEASDPTVAPATIAATTIAPTTTVPVPTTLPADQVFLRSDGIGSFTFGASYEGFEEGIALEEDSNDGMRFPIDLGDGFFSIDGTPSGLAFAYPRGREVCWNDGLDGVNGYLCAYFGGPDADTLQFVGWEYRSATGIGELFTSHGVTVNALARDVPAIPELEQDACGSATVRVDEVVVDLVSDTGEVVVGGVAAADARVIAMRAGEVPRSDGCKY